MKNICEVMKKYNIDEIIQYGNYMGKINPITTFGKGKVVLVTATNPTEYGEGKTTVAIGLNDALNLLNKKSLVNLREPSMGPVFGLKGGATGGGKALILPEAEINLHFTGDFHAITSANNLISAAIDNEIFHDNKLDIREVTFNRCLDMNDRALRNIKLSGRNEHFDITAASELMAIMCLSKNILDLRMRLDNIIIGYNSQLVPIYVSALGITDALISLLIQAFKPNFVQTLEGNGAIVHGGPFANIAHGCNSIMATKYALKFGEYIITEAGFGADLGAEKFLDIKCREGKLTPDCVVIVATVRALKMHGGVEYDNLKEENVEALAKGIENLAKHIDSIQKFNLPYVVAVNQFTHDTEAELEFLKKWCEENNHPCEIANVWLNGGAGAKELANRVIELVENNDQTFKVLYEREAKLEDKILTIAREIYGARDVVYTPAANRQIAELEKFELDKLPICMAKTQYSLSDNPTLLGRPENFDITVKEVRVSNGAGFIVVLTGDIMTMPGLPKVPAANRMDILENGEIIGLF